MKRLFLAIAFLLLPAQVFAASCNVTEFSLIAPSGVQVAQMPPLVDQPPVTTSGTSAQSAAFSDGTKMIRAFCDTQSAIVIGSNPTATTNNMPMPAAAGEYFNVTPGHKTAFILRP